MFLEKHNELFLKRSYPFSVELCFLAEIFIIGKNPEYMQKCFPKGSKIFFAGPTPRMNIYCPTEEYIRTYDGVGSDIFWEGNITHVSQDLL